MSTLQDLIALENELKQTLAYDAKKDNAAQLVEDYFTENGGAEPTDPEMNAHFLQRHYAKIDIDPADDTLSSNTLEEAFYEFISIALFSRFKSKTVEANEFFTRAAEIATRLNNTFVSDQHTFAKGLAGENLKKKLKAERCYELVNQTLAINKDDGVKLIGAGLALADAINDERRILDFLSKCIYVLYEFETFKHVAMSLGHYLLSKTGSYATLKNWTRFHIGNIWIDLQKYQSAKDEYEQALDWALQTGFPYATMTMYERLALACFRLNKFSLAEQFYDDSLLMGQTEPIDPEMVLKNEIRCLIGLGNIQYKQAIGSEKNTKCKLADDFFKQALQRANRVNYPANKKVTLMNLSELYKLWHGDNDPDAKTFRELADQIS
jgi:tetratricopeptide (TPR) repeat protein